MIERSGEETLLAQKQAAIDLIKAGRENDVSSIEITLDQMAGLDLGSDVEGIPIKVKVGKSGHMTIRVEYPKRNAAP